MTGPVFSAVEMIEQLGVWATALSDIAHNQGVGPMLARPIRE